MNKHSIQHESGILLSRKDKQDVTGKCRVCLQPGIIPIFGKKKNYAQDINEIAAVVILEFDDLPKHICENCYKLLQSGLLFRRIAKRTDFELRTKREILIYENFKVKEENESVCSELNETSVYGEPFVKCEYLEVSTQEEEDSDFESDKKTTLSLDDNISVNQDGEYDVEYLDIENTDEEITEGESNHKTLEESGDNAKNSSSLKELPNNKIDKCGMIKCDVCNEFVRKDLYKVHIKLHRSAYKEKTKKYKKVECEICHKLIYKNYYKYHKKLVHGNETEKAEILKECPYCSRKISARNIAKHIKSTHEKTDNHIINSEGLKKQCLICDRNIKEENYKQHLANHGNKRKVYICETCGNKCATASALQTHMLTHGNELKYKCNFCPYRGLHLSLLRIHVRTHTKDYNYKCSLCPAKFLTKSNLSIHMQRHTGIGKYKCEECDKRFYVKRNMVNHYKSAHCSERNFKCDLCEKSFPHRDGMLSHQIKAHKRDKLINQSGRLPTYLKNELKSSEEL